MIFLLSFFQKLSYRHNERGHQEIYCTILQYCTNHTLTNVTQQKQLLAGFKHKRYKRVIEMKLHF